MEDHDKILDYTKPVRFSDDCNKNRKNFTQGYYYREIGRYKNVVPSEFQWAAEDKLINKTTYEELKCQLPGSPRSTFLMVFSPDGKKVASTHGNHNVYVTDLTTGKNIQTLSGHPRTPWCIAFHPSSNQILASGCLGGQVRVWDLHGGSEVWTTESQSVIASLAFHPIDRMLVIATYNELHFWDWSQPEPFAKCSTKSGREKVRYVSFDRLGHKLITGIANPVNAPSTGINVHYSQTPTTSTTTTTSTTSTSFNSTPPTTIVSFQPSNEQGRSITLYHNFINRQLVSLSRNTPTIDRGTDPMDLLDLSSSRNNNSEGNTSNPSPSTSNSQANSSSPLRFNITPSASRSCRPLSFRESLRFHSEVVRRVTSRLSHSLNSTASSTTAGHSSVFTNPSTSSTATPISRNTYIPRLRPCSFSLSPTARSWCLTLTPENSSSLFSSRNTPQTTSSGAITNPTFTSYSNRGILSTRESSSSNSGRAPFSVVRPYRLLFEDGDGWAPQRETQSEPERESTEEPRSSSSNSGQNDQRTGRNNLASNPPESTMSSNPNLRISSPEIEIERELQRSNSGLRRQETESTVSNRELHYNSELFRNGRSICQLIPLNLRNISPVRRFRDEANSDGELTENSRRENHSAHQHQSLMHPRPVPRFQVRSRFLQDQQSQLHLLSNRETHGLNLQNNQSLRRQLSFRPGGQFMLSRHSNSPFQPRVSHQTESPTQTNSPAPSKITEPRFEIPSRRSSFNTSSSNTSEAGTSSSSSSGKSSSVASKLSFTGESSQQLPDQINRHLFDLVNKILGDRIRNSSENASTDSTVNYSRISGEAEAERDPLDCEDGVATRGLGPRGADPMLSSVSENLDSTNELLHSGSSPVSPSVNGSTSNSNSLNISHSDLLDPWESEADSSPFSISAPLPLNDVLDEQPQESGSHTEAESSEQNQTPPVSNNGAIDNSNPSSSEFNMRQGIQLLSFHIENMQRLCWARMEILQLQKIRKMWEDLKNQIRQFHNIIQNRRLDNSTAGSGLNDSSNSAGDIPSMRNLAISSSPTPERNSENSTSSDALYEFGGGSFGSNFRELVESNINELLNERREPSLNVFQKFKNSSGEKSTQRSNFERSSSSDNKPGNNETEEPQPGPSGVLTPSTSASIRNSVLQLECRVYRFLQHLIQKSRRRREARTAGMGTASGPQRHGQSSGGRSSIRLRIRGQSHIRLGCDTRELKAMWQRWRNERSSSRTSQPFRARGGGDISEPSTSTPRTSTSSDACQSCGQKKKPVKEYCRQKRRSMDSSSGLGSSGSPSKILKNNVGERKEAPASESPPDTSNPSTSQPQDNSTNDLLRQMFQTVEKMRLFQHEAFRSTKNEGRDRVSRPAPAPSSGEDSDSDQNDSNERSETIPRSTTERGSRESAVDSVQDNSELRVKKLLGVMVKSLNQFFGKNFRNLNQEQILCLYMLLDLALVLTDVLIEQLSDRSRNLEQNWGVNNLEERKRNWSLPRSSGIAERMRERSRRPYISFYSTIREDPRIRFSTNPFLRSHSSLISTRRNSSGTPTIIHERFSGSGLSSSCRRKRTMLRTSNSGLHRWYYRRGRTSSQASTSSSNPTTPNRPIGGISLGNRYRNFCSDRRLSLESNFGYRGWNSEINNNSSNNNDTNNNYNSNDDRNINISSNNNNNSNNNNSNNNNNINNNNNNNNTNNNNNNDDNNNNNNNNDNDDNSNDNDDNDNDNNNDNNSSNNGSSNSNNSNINAGSSSNVDNRSVLGGNSISEISNNINSFLNYHFSNSGNNNSNSENGNNVITVTGLNNSSENRSNANNSSQSGGNVSFLSQNSLPPLRSMELTLSRNESGDLRDERPILWISYGGNNETSASATSNDSQSRVSGFTVPIVQVNDVPVPDVSMLNQPRHRPQSPVPRVPEDFWRWRAWRPRFLLPRQISSDDPDLNDLPEHTYYFRIPITSLGSHPGLHPVDPMVITDAPMSPHHRIQAWDFSKMMIPDISDREANGVVPECKIHNDASVDVSNDGHLLVTLLPSGRLSVTTMLGVYSLDWSSLGQLLYRTSFEQNAVSVSLSPTNRHLLVGLASRPVVLRDRTNMAQIFRLEGGRPSPHGGSWQSGRGRLVHMRDLEQTREINSMSLNCIRWAPGAGQGLVYGTNTGQLRVLR